MLIRRQRGERHSIWVEELPSPSAGTTAARARAVEMRRGLRSDSVWRAVLLNYSDAISDLIIVASRLHFRWCDIDALATELLEGRPLVVPLAGEAACGAAQSCGEECVESSPVGAVDTLRLVGAVGLTAAAFFQMETPLIEVYTEESPLAALVPVDPGISSTAAFLGGIRQSLEQPVWNTAQVRSGLGKEGIESDICIAVIAEADLLQATHPARVESKSLLDLPHALAFELVRSADAGARIACRFSGHRYSKDLLQVVVNTAAAVYLQLDGHRMLQEIELASRTAFAPEPQMPDAGTLCRIDELLSQVAGCQPGARAVSCGDVELSYSELDERATRIGAYLQSMGIGRGARVGLFLERGAELILLMLASWKVGASYVPIDARCPAERLRFIAQDAGLRLLICDTPCERDLCCVSIGAHELLARAERATVHRCLPEDVSPADEAYIIYTSGSTGRPKGVSVAHANVVSLVSATRVDFNLTANDVWSFFHSPAFDFSVWEIWGCLLTGGRLVVVPYATSRDPAAFQRLLETERVSVLSQTPSAFQLLIARLRRAEVHSPVRLVVLGGEPLNARALLPWFDRVPESQCRVVNMYGITETTVHVTAETITRAHALSRSRSVGVPIAGWAIDIVDNNGRPLPPGVAGEIWVSGLGVANGYVNRPELTERRFVRIAGRRGRTYRSGDKGRLRLDGRIEHLGRLDNQVKLRGFRIELDEIRTVLLATRGVAAAAVTLRRRVADDAGTAEIVAFVVLTEGSVSGVKRHLGTLLPDYMVPAAVIAVPSLPVTANGKLDVQGLCDFADRTANAVQPAGTGTAAGDPLALVRSALTAALGVPLGDDENFFEAGGNSLAAIRFIEHLQKSGVESLAPRDVYDRQTGTELARLLADRSVSSHTRLLTS